MDTDILSVNPIVIYMPYSLISRLSLDLLTTTGQLINFGYLTAILAETKVKGSYPGGFIRVLNSLFYIGRVPGKAQFFVLRIQILHIII